MLMSSFTSAQRSKAFNVIPLGVLGGADESNLSCYMVKASKDKTYVTFDAGSLNSGIQKAVSIKALKGKPNDIIKDSIAGYLISHAHLDHIAGMILNSPDDKAKPIYALPSVIKVLKERYFTWEAWANFANEGELPVLKKYTYSYLGENEWIPLVNTNLSVRAFSLSHGPGYESTAFLVRNNNDYLLYLGDTGADEIEHSDKLEQLWKAIAPIVLAENLRGIFIEVSFPNEQPSANLFGHLKPELFFKEMKKLGDLSSIEKLRKVPIVITHIKPSLNGNLIRPELLKQNQLLLNLVFPQQGKALRF